MFDNADVLPRFLVSELDSKAGIAVLTEGEAHHLTRVLRLGVGDTVAIFDGRGREFTATIDRIAGATVQVKLGAAIEPVPERSVPVTLAQAILKGSSMDDVVRDATMLGVHSIVPLVTAHTVARKATSPHGADRWRRVALASAKQCRRARIPEVGDPIPFAEWGRRHRDAMTLFLVEPSVSGVAARPMRALASAPAPEAVTLVIGPEGGWSPGEVSEALGNGLLPVTLGPLTLRAEAVALAALAALTVVWD